MTKKFNAYQKIYRAFLLALLIFFGAILGRPAGYFILAHPAQQEGGPALENTGEPPATETPLPDSAGTSNGAPAEATPTPNPLPTETPTPEPPLPAAETVVRVAPADLPLALGSTGQSEIQVESATGLYGVDFQLTFDPELVSIVDADSERAGTQIGLGTLFQGQDIFLIRNQVNLNTGVIEFAVTLRQPAPPIEGDGTLAAITWQALKPGVILLTPQTNLSDTTGGVISHTVVTGKLTITGETGEPITGRLLLQGRTSHQGTQVFLSPESCATAPQTNGPGVLITETNSEGTFEFLPPAGVTYYCLQAVKPGYLVGRKVDPQGDIGVATLLGGDVTGDGIIDIFDLAFLGSRYGDKDTLADINGDGTVSIFDLTITAANYLSEGPVTLDQ